MSICPCCGAIDAEAPPGPVKCTVTDCPTEGKVNERGVCEGCAAAMRGD